MTQEVSELLKHCPLKHGQPWQILLLKSLDETIDEGVEEEWNAEIARRIQELDSGKVKPIAWAEARRQVSAILNGR